MNTASKKLAPHISGEASMWILLLGDMVIYALLFFMYGYDHRQEAALFRESQTTLNAGFGFANTLILLTSSWLVVMGLKSAKTNQRASAANFFKYAMLCGAAFGVSKFIEYGLKINSGIELTDNSFYMYYFLLTGFHFIHVIIGMTTLFFMRRHVLGENFSASSGNSISGLESGANFWHLVDLLWILIFPLLYLIG